jgi:hypothetical protein
MNTKGSVHGSTIIERPAKYERINHEEKPYSLLASGLSSVVNPKITPIKITENNPKQM